MSIFTGKAVESVAGAAGKISDGMTKRREIEDAPFKNIREMNLIDAARGSFFDKGWRPFIGWSVAFGWTYNLLVWPMLHWLSMNAGWAPPPVIDDVVLAHATAIATGVVIARSFDKQKKIKLLRRKRR